VDVGRRDASTDTQAAEGTQVTDLTIATVHEWYCPNCGKRDQSREVKPHSRFHTCPKLHGLTAPFVKAGTHAEVKALIREDYVNGETVQFDDRRKPVMSIITTRDNGQDVAILAPAATAKGDA
jgi:predicted RNA-binding Zn-ribbon protein involved in translation (DUF1610 family)